MASILPKITSSQNSWIKALCRLHRRSDRTQQQRFLLEGPILVEEAIATNWPLEAICFNASWANSNSVLLKHFADSSNDAIPQLQPVSDEVLRKLATTDSPCSVVAIAKMNKPEISKTSEEGLHLQEAIVALESIQDPGNLGTLVRIAAAVGRTSVVASADSVDPTSPKVLRSSTGQWFRTPPLIADLRTLIQAQRKKDFQILAATADGASMWDVDLTKPMVLLLGNEGAGLSREIRSLATASVSIPMALGVESLNVSVAGGLILYERKRQLETRK